MDIKALAAGLGAHATTPASRPDPARVVPQPAADVVAPPPAAPRRGLSISVDQETGKTIVQVLDLETGDVIRQVPGEEQMALARALGSLDGHRLDTQA
jgi:flagellar protein FlaG